MFCAVPVVEKVSVTPLPPLKRWFQRGFASFFLRFSFKKTLRILIRPMSSRQKCQDQSGLIDYEEFQKLLSSLIKVRNLRGSASIST